MNREEIQTDINENVYTNTTKRIKGNTIRDRLRNIATNYLNWDSDVVSTINGESPSADVIPNEIAVAEYVAVHSSGVTPSLQDVTTEGNSTLVPIVIEDAGVDDLTIDSNSLNYQNGGMTTSLVFEAPTGVGAKIFIEDTNGTDQIIAWKSDIPSTPDLNSVVGVGNTVTDKIIDVSKTSTNSKIWFGGNFIQFFRTNVGNRSTQVNFTAPTADHILAFPAKSGTLATTDDIPTYVDRFKGKYTSLSALNTARPTGSDGDYAIVDSGVGANATEYIWDAQEGWVPAASVGAATTDALPEGSSNLYFTNARADARVAAATHAASSKTTPADTDEIPLSDGAASWVLKKLTWANLKASAFVDTVVGVFIAGYTAKSIPVDADVFLGSDSADTNKAKKFTWANIKAVMLGETTIGSAINGYTSKTTPVDADMIPLMDSADSNKVKKFSFANLKAAFDSRYIAASQGTVLAETATNGATSSGTSNTYSTGVLITPDMINADTTIEVIAGFRKTGVSGTCTIRLYANNTNDLSGSPILIGGLQQAANVIYAPISRLLKIKTKNGSGAGTEVATASNIASYTDYANFTTAVSNLAIDWTSNKYVIAAIQTANGGDAALVTFLKVRR